MNTLVDDTAKMWIEMKKAIVQNQEALDFTKEETHNAIEHTTGMFYKIYDNHEKVLYNQIKMYE
jgi:hypothetical protein